MIFGLAGMIEQEAARIISGGDLEQNLIWSAVCFALFVLGVLLATGKNLSRLSFGPVELTLKEQREELADRERREGAE